MTDATTRKSMVQKKVLIDIKECSFKACMSSYAVKVTRAKIATLNYTKGHTHSHDVEYWVSAFLDCVFLSQIVVADFRDHPMSTTFVTHYNTSMSQL